MPDTICIMGGTFNPFHNGHLQLAKQAHEQFSFSKILIMPSGTPAHKAHSHLISSRHRCNMVLAAINAYPYMELSTMEIDRGGSTYTSDTLRELKRANPNITIYFIIGADSLYDLPKWHEPEYVMSNCFLLAANRNRHSQRELADQKKFLEETYDAHISFLNTPELPFSSTSIRESLKAGKSITGMVPASVETYIYNHHLYWN